jgi:PAS domain S-box-containing protein
MALDHADPIVQASRADVFRALFDRAQIGMFWSTLDGRFLLANAALARQLGYNDPASLVAATGAAAGAAARPLYAVPAHRAAMVEQLRRAGHVDGFAIEGRRRDGTRFWASLSATLLHDGDDGAAPTMLGTLVDVSELARSQTRFNFAAAEVGRVFDNAAEGIYRSTPDGRQLRANPALVRLNGYDSEDELLTAVNDIASEWYVEPGRRAAFKALLERDGRIAGFESEVYRHKTRERIWVSENAWIVRDEQGRALFYEGTVIDITERRRAAQALSDNEERFRDFAETASDWFWETDAEHRFSYMSPRVTTYGIPRDRSIGMRRIDIAWEVGSEPEKWKAHQATLDRHEPFRDFTYRNWLEGDEFIHITVSGKPVFDAEGRFQGYRGTARDITEQVQAEERLRAAMMEAEAANQAKISFLANMSHELRTPLNAILGFSEMIRDQLLGPDSPRYVEYASFISDSGSHLLTLVNDVLDMAKIDAGHMTLTPSEVDLPALIRRQVAMMAPRATARGVAIAVDCAADFPRLEVDELRMRQIVLNLLSNAVKFTPAQGRVTATARIDAAGRPVIAIADTGIGMTADEIALALEPFRQVETHLDRTQEGTGLGLPITRNLVALHRGELVIASEPGRGTTVEVILPASVVVL